MEAKKLQETIPPESFQVVIAEFNALKDEIKARTTGQLYCVTASIASVATVVGFVIKNPVVYAKFLPIVPWILTIFGIIWCDHDRSIARLGKYIKEEMEEKKIPRLTNNKQFALLNWETYCIKNKPRFNLGPARIEFLIPVLFFIFPSASSLIIYLLLMLTGIVSEPIWIHLLVISVCSIFVAILAGIWWDFSTLHRKNIKEIKKYMRTVEY